MFTVYTKDGCPQCDSAKQLLINKNESFNAVKIGADITLAEFRQSYPAVKAVPFIIHNEQTVGGMHELNKLLTDK